MERSPLHGRHTEVNMPAKALPKPGPEVNGQYARATARLKKEATRWTANRPPPAGAAPALSAAEKAKRLRDAPAAYLYAAAAPVLGEAMDIETWKLHLTDFLKELGVTKASGPVARMMAEQLLLAHHAVARLHVRAATRTSPAEVAAYHAAVSRLMTEFRRTSAALRAYGAGAARRAAVAPRATASTPSAGRRARRAKTTRRSKLGSNRVRGRIRGKHPVG
jgi:hypothetical protein